MVASDLPESQGSRNGDSRFEDCTKKEWHSRQQAVSNTCKGTLSGRRCRAGMSQAAALDNAAKFEVCAAARAAINHKCDRGGDLAHIKARQEALEAAQRCRDIASMSSTDSILSGGDHD